MDCVRAAITAFTRRARPNFAANAARLCLRIAQIAKRRWRTPGSTSRIIAKHAASPYGPFLKHKDGTLTIEASLQKLCGSIVEKAGLRQCGSGLAACDPHNPEHGHLRERGAWNENPQRCSVQIGGSNLHAAV